MLSPGFHPVVGGAEKQALELSKTLSAKGASVRVITRAVDGSPANEIVEGIEVTRLPVLGTGPLNALSFLRASLKKLKEWKGTYDVVHTHLAGSPALAAGWIARRTGVLAVAKVGGGRGIGEIAVSRRTAPGRLKLALFRRLPIRFVCVTQDLVEELSEAGLKENAVVIPNGVDTTHYRPPKAGEKEALRSQLGLPSGTLFLYVGRFAPEKLLPDLIGRFAERTSPDSSLVCVGSGPEEEAMRRAADASGLGSRLRVIAPMGPIEEVYRACDVFVLPSTSEGLSNALLEAMSSGLAVLGTCVGGTAEAVRSDQEGLLYPVGDPDALRGALARLSSSESDRARFGSAARKRVLSRFSLDSVAESYLSLYKGSYQGI